MPGGDTPNDARSRRPSGSSTARRTELRQSLTAPHLSRVSLHRLRAARVRAAFQVLSRLLISSARAPAPSRSARSPARSVPGAGRRSPGCCARPRRLAPSQRLLVVPSGLSSLPRRMKPLPCCTEPSVTGPELQRLLEVLHGLGILSLAQVEVSEIVVGQPGRRILAERIVPEHLEAREGVGALPGSTPERE